MLHVDTAGRRSWRLAACLLLAPVLAFVTTAASTVRPLNLEELVGRAGRIVVGRCVRVEVEPHPKHGVTTTLVTLAVESTLKGEARETLAFRMFGGPPGDDAAIGGLPAFRPGESLILFLYPEGRSGLTSPVGFGQGTFRVLRDKAGIPIASNGSDNRALLDRLSPAATRRLLLGRQDLSAPRRLSSDRLVELVEALRP